MGEQAFEQRLEKAQKGGNGEHYSCKRELASLSNFAGTGFDQHAIAKNRAKIARQLKECADDPIAEEARSAARAARAKARTEESAEESAEECDAGEVFFSETFPIP